MTIMTRYDLLISLCEATPHLGFEFGLRLRLLGFCFYFHLESLFLKITTCLILKVP